MSQKAIKAILEARLNTWAGAQSPAIRIAWENVPFTPISGETYIRCQIIPNEAASDDLAGEHRLYRGVFQMSIVRPAGSSAGPVYDIVASLNAQFPVNGRYTSGAVAVQVVTPVSAGPAITEESTYTVPAWFRYRCDTI